MSGLGRELWFLWRDRAAKVWLLIGFAAAGLAVVFGLMEIAAQRDTIERLKAADEIERAVTTEAHREDWGSAATTRFISPTTRLRSSRSQPSGNGTPRRGSIASGCWHWRGRSTKPTPPILILR